MRAVPRGAGALRAPVPALAPAVGLAVALAVVLAGCGVPGSGSEQVPSSEVPPGLVGPAPAREPAGVGAGRASGAPSAPPAPRPPSTYLVTRDAVGTRDVLVPVPLEPQGDAAPDTAPLDDEAATVLATRLVRALGLGPTPVQRDQGLSSALSAGVPARLVEVVDGTASVALRQPDRGPADRLWLAPGQVVLTVTSVPGITSVRLLHDGEPAAAVLPGGERSDDPVTALDYADLLAAP